MRRSDTIACKPDGRYDTETRPQGSRSTRLPRHLSLYGLKARRLTYQPAYPAHCSLGEPYVSGSGGVCLGGVWDFVANDEEPECVDTARALTPVFCSMAPKQRSSPTTGMV
jgi:hypothetical protein